MPKIIRHIAGPYEEGVQLCLICGEILADYRNAAWPIGQKPPSGFAEGELFFEGKNPTSIYSTLAQGDTAINCDRQ